MNIEERELGTIILTYESNNKRVEMFTSEEPSWPEQLRTYFEFLRAVGFFIEPEAEEEGIEAVWETHQKFIRKGEY